MHNENEIKVIVREIKNNLSLDSAVCDIVKVPIPEPFCFNKRRVKAFVLGADPSNFSNKGKPVILKTVFGIGSGDARYFKNILLNLKAVGLELEDVYVQNLVPVYLKSETGKNKKWSEIAEYFIEHLRKEFYQIDKKGNTPVLITAEQIMKFLLSDKKDYHKAKDYYNSPELLLPIQKTQNKLDRLVFPFYRHLDYKLTLQRQQRFRNFLKNQRNRKIL